MIISVYLGATEIGTAQLDDMIWPIWGSIEALFEPLPAYESVRPQVRERMRLAIDQIMVALERYSRAIERIQAPEPVPTLEIFMRWREAEEALGFIIRNEAGEEVQARVAIEEDVRTTS